MPLYRYCPYEWNRNQINRGLFHLVVSKYPTKFEVFMKKIGRNDPCSCGSGKKLKKCCESLRSGFIATRINNESAPSIKKIVELSGFFQEHLAITPKKL